MLPLPQKILFLMFAAVMCTLGVHGFRRLYRRIAAGETDTDSRFNGLPGRIWRSLVTTFTQSRTFRKRPVISFFHAFIFYGFTFYLLVNLVDAIEGFIPLSLSSLGIAGHLYVLFADVLSFLVLVGVIALVLRRFLLPSRRDFNFNPRTLLHKDVKEKYISLDSLIVSAFILFHVGSRAIGAGAKLTIEGPDRFAPFASLLSHLFSPQNAAAWRIFGYWGALGSVLAFLVYFPYSKHVHIFMAPVKYLVARETNSGVLPALTFDTEVENPKLGAARLEDLAWPRLLDAYACIQCNRCQDVCPATKTGKALSPSALEINKRMELNDLSRHQPSFESGAPSPNPLLTFALSPEATWACTTCGACVDICPVGDEPMLDIIDIRRQQVMVEGDFPAQLQTAFRGMERAKNPWGINREKRLDWAAGLKLKTTDENPEPDVLFWVGCAASYDPQAQKTARAFVQLLDHAGVDFAVLGKRECCTGDSARRAGNEYLYHQLADENVATLNEIRPKLIVATCPHCMNTVGNEYRQLGGNYKVMHHTEYLNTLVADGKLVATTGSATITYHDPCYLGRHNGIYDAPRNLLNILGDSVVELPRNRENSFCCGAGGAQFWKEEEAGTERISDNRYREVEQRLEGADQKVLAVGCPFCKSMLESTPGRAADPIPVRDIAELLWEGVQRSSAASQQAAENLHLQAEQSVPQLTATQISAEISAQVPVESVAEAATPALSAAFNDAPAPALEPPSLFYTNQVKRKTWAPRLAQGKTATSNVELHASAPAVSENTRAGDRELDGLVPSAVFPQDTAPPPGQTQPHRKIWSPKRTAAPSTDERMASDAPTPPTGETHLSEVSATQVSATPEVTSPAPPSAPRKAWTPKTALPKKQPTGSNPSAEPPEDSPEPK